MQLPEQWNVPAFSENIFFERNHSYAVVIPVINEGNRIKKQLQEMQRLAISQQADIVIADGGSTDDSLPDALLRETGVRALLVKQGKGKLSAQLRMGYAWVLAQGYEGIITIDGNGKDSVSSIELFIDALHQGTDYAQASRFIKGGMHENTPLSRVLAIRLLHAPISSLGARHWFTDTTQGFRAYSRRYLMDDRVLPFRDCFMDYELLAYLTVRATRLGYIAREIPTSRIYPADAPPPTKITSVASHINLLHTLIAAALGFYNP